MSPLYHGITVRDAVLMVHAWGGTTTANTIRSWINRGNVHRTKDGQVDPFSLEQWWSHQRDHARATRGNAA